MKTITTILFVALNLPRLFSGEDLTHTILDKSLWASPSSEELIDSIPELFRTDKRDDDVEKLLEVNERYKCRGPKNEFGRPKIYVACAYGDEEAVRILAKYGADMNSEYFNLIQMLYKEGRGIETLPAMSDKTRVKMFHLVLSLGAKPPPVSNYLFRIALAFHHMGEPALTLLEDAINHGAPTQGMLETFTRSDRFVDSPDNFLVRALRLLVANGATWD